MRTYLENLSVHNKQQFIIKTLEFKWITVSYTDAIVRLSIIRPIKIHGLYALQHVLCKHETITRNALERFK